MIYYPFVTQYSLSVDLYITNLTGHTGLERLIFYSASTPFNPATFPFNPSMSLSENIATTAPQVSMICYIDDNTNNLIITYMLKKSSSVIQRSSYPIQNIPLYEPFRITIVYDTNIFTVYLNGVQVSQTTVDNTTPINPGQNQFFFANTLPTKCGYVQTLLLWTRPIQYNELVAMPVALTGTAKFNIPPTAKTLAGGVSSGDSCSTSATDPIPSATPLSL
jgi:hypothetical protein